MTEVDLFISTQRIKVLNADSQVSAQRVNLLAGDSFTLEKLWKKS